MSWSNITYLDTFTRRWGMKKNFSYGVNFEIMFENVMKRCGRFLTKIAFEHDSHVNDANVSTMTMECPKLQDIDLNWCVFRSRNEIDTIIPVFKKVKKFDCNFWYAVSNEDLKELFLLNDSLECLKLDFDEEINFSIFDFLPNETIKELAINCANGFEFRETFNVSISYSIINLL